MPSIYSVLNFQMNKIDLVINIGHNPVNKTALIFPKMRIIYLFENK